MIEPVRGQPLWESVLERLRAAILAGELRPGEKLVEADLAERLGTSRGPIREAVRELVREGLVVEFPRRGNVVSTLTARDLAEVYAVREALEVAVARLVGDKVGEDALAELESLLDEFELGAGDYLANSVHDLAFHRALVALAGNSRMTAINEQMLRQTAHLLRSAAEATPALQTPIRPAAHRDIVAALRARDPDAARAAIAAHYRYAEERLFPGLA
ncbi:MAG TPA: GntR family transcriptional regulator [Gaiella sp.]|jgi:DNA-binding GntR family transcriptional regulator